MAAVSDVTALTSALTFSDAPVRPSDVEAPPAASLDDLPVEILMEIASSLDYYYGFQTVCKCPFRALIVISATDSNQTWAN